MEEIEQVSEIEKVLDNPQIVETEYNEEWQEIKVESEIITKDKKLTPRQEKFCQLYTTDSWCFGNWVTTYLEVYDVDTSKKWWYSTATSMASRLLTNVKVCKRINELLETQGLNNEFLDQQTLFLISQHADLWVKARMIWEYNKLKGRIIEKIEHSWNINEFKNLSVEELLKRKTELWQNEKE